MMQAVPANTSCINSLEIGQSQRQLMHYYTGINLQEFEKTNQLNCNYYLIQDTRGSAKMQPSDEWKLIWHGKRKADRKESFRLFERQ
jgi:hypothetical protein